MKATALLAIVALAGSAIAGSTQYQPDYESSEANVGHPSCRYKNAGTPGASYRSNCSRNAVYLRNDTSEYVTFFVYFRDLDGPNTINSALSQNAFVYERVVAPHQVSRMDQRARYYCVGSREGKWAVGDRGIVPQY